MPDKVLVTGATGFIGRHLIERLARSRPGSKIAGTTRGLDPPYNRGLVKPHARVISVDMRRYPAVQRIISRIRPDYIFHLAAQSLPTVSWSDPWYTLETNVLGTTNLFEAIRRCRLDPAVLVACSSAEYGLVRPAELPTPETHPLRPLHPYGVSKVAQDLLAYQYFMNSGIRSIRARIFNTSGPGKTGDVLSDWTWAIVALERKGGGTLPVGNLNTRRDISDVRDQVRALDLGIDRLRYGEAYNFARSEPYKLRALLRQAIEMAQGPIRAVVSPKLLRPTDERVIWGDNRKLLRALRIHYEIPIERTISDMLEFARRRPTRTA